MRAIVIHRSFEVMGGAERVALATMEALREMGFKLTLVTMHRPDFDAIEKACGMDFKVDRVRFVFPLCIDLSNWPIHFQALPPLLTMVSCSALKADLIINTHAEIPLPYFTLTLPYSTLNGAPLISYVHQPPLHALMDGEYSLKYGQSIPWRLYFTSYRLLFGYVFDQLERYGIAKSVILTNSEFTKKAITSLYAEAEPIIVRPPVDVDTFIRVLKSESREDRVLVIARIDPEKHIENAIELARLLPKQIECTIVGACSSSERAIHYNERLSEIIRCYGLEGRVKIETNVSSTELLELMARSKVYFHTMQGEHFGIAIVEAMAAGLIPIVPDYGGQTEFVPKQYQYHTLAQAAEIVKSLIDVPQSERSKVSNIAKRFSRERFKSRIKNVIRHYTE